MFHSFHEYYSKPFSPLSWVVKEFYVTPMGLEPMTPTLTYRYNFRYHRQMPSLWFNIGLFSDVCGLDYALTILGYVHCNFEAEVSSIRLINSDSPQCHFIV